MLAVHQIVNSPVPSNCFVIYDKAACGECLIVDPGSKSDDELVHFLRKEALNPTYILLTHEHFDHCWGVNELVRLYHIPIVCSALCAENIRQIKKNCSVFYDHNQSFEIHSETLSVESIHNCMNFNGHRMNFFLTQGHTDAGISFTVDNYLFTGDTLIKDCVTVTKLPTGSVGKLKKSIALYAGIDEDYMVMCGHGESFRLCEYDLNKMIK